ncbi:MAG TPA: hypothetical protein VFG30_04770, partial [Polyangiales bacterium]|nr:hypothetical protein [Polyangiales bacterium]
MSGSPVAKVVFLVGQIAGATQSTLLLIGSGALADSLAKVLGGQGVMVERAASAQGAQTAHVLAPDLIVLVGDAASDRGVAVLAQLTRVSADTLVPVLVICAPELGGVISQPPPRHVGFLSPEGGVAECARRVQAVVQLFMEEGLATCSLQELADTVAPRPKQKPTDVASKASVAGAVEQGAKPVPVGATSAGGRVEPAKVQPVAAVPSSLRSAIASAGGVGRGPANTQAAVAPVAKVQASAAASVKQPIAAAAKSAAMESPVRLENPAVQKPVVQKPAVDKAAVAKSMRGVEPIVAGAKQQPMAAVAKAVSVEQSAMAAAKPGSVEQSATAAAKPGSVEQSATAAVKPGSVEQQSATAAVKVARVEQSARQQKPAVDNAAPNEKLTSGAEPKIAVANQQPTGTASRAALDERSAAVAKATSAGQPAAAAAAVKASSVEESAPHEKPVVDKAAAKKKAMGGAEPDVARANQQPVAVA